MILIVTLNMFFIISYADEPIKIESKQSGTGLILNEGQSGEIYGGLRWPEFADKSEWLTIKAGTGGVKIVSHDGKKELIAVDNFGGIYLNGDVYINGTKVNDAALEKDYVAKDDVVLLFAGTIILALTIMIYLVYKLRTELNKLRDNLEQ